VCVFYQDLFEFNGVFHVQARHEIKVQINTSYETEKCFYHFQINEIAVSAIEGH